MYHFAKTSPEITSTTVKHVTEIVKHLKKESIDTKLPPPHHAARIERCFLLGDLKQESVRKNFQNNAFSRRYLDTHDSI
jgi:hypothetical protein